MVVKNFIKSFFDLHYYGEVKRKNFYLGSDEWLANWRLIYVHLFLLMNFLWFITSILGFKYISNIMFINCGLFTIYGYFLCRLISRLLYKSKEKYDSYFMKIAKDFDAKYLNKASLIYWLFVLYETLIIVLASIVFIFTINYTDMWYDNNFKLIK